MRRGHLPKEINNLRLGECLLLGRDMAFDVDIEGLSQDTMRLEAELVEVRAKRTLPVGEIGHDAFGNVPVFVDHGTRRQGILAVGKQDVNVAGLTPLDEGVKIVFTSAGSPKKFTPMLHEAGIKVAHVVSSSKFARKCEEAGVDAVVAEGFEAGGHNGREETTTMTLIPQVRRATSLPLIAAGGIASGEAMLASMVLGAEGVQIGTLFALTEESSAADAFKQRCVSLEEGDTMLCLKKISPTRLIKNGLYDKVKEAEDGGASVDELRDILGKAASKRGIFEGDVDGGELEIGQITSAIKSVRPVAEVMKELVEGFEMAKENMME